MLSDIDVAKAFVKATKDILSTMACLEARPGTPFVKKRPMAMGEISAIVGVTGEKRGTISVSFTIECATALVRGMLGDDIHDLETDMQDAVGEVVNMVSGQTRSILAEQGMLLHGSTPSIIAGKEHTIRHMSSSQPMALPFSTDAGEFTVEFCLE